MATLPDAITLQRWSDGGDCILRTSPNCERTTHQVQVNGVWVHICADCMDAIDNQSPSWYHRIKREA